MSVESLENCSKNCTQTERITQQELMLNSSCDLLLEHSGRHYI